MFIQASDAIGRQVRRRVTAARVVLARHRVMVVLLVAGIGLRVVTQLAYRPALLYIDSLRYLRQLATLDPRGLDPIGYDAFLLKPLTAVGGLGLVVAVQHLTALAMAVGIYVLLLRCGAARWLAALATAPVLLDAYQLQVEQNVMSDELFEVIIVALLLVLGWRRVLSPWAAAAAGLLCVAALMVRLVAIGLIVPIAIYVLIVLWQRRHAGAKVRSLLKPAAALVLAFGAGIFCYAGYFHAWTGQWGLTASTGTALYGRTAAVADCANLHLPPDARRLCPTQPPSRRHAPDYYAHNRGSPVLQLQLHEVPLQDITASIGRFNHAVLTEQPVDVAQAALTDLAKGFRWRKADAPGDVPVSRWQFQTFYPVFPLDTAHVDPALSNVNSLTALRRAGYPGPTVNRTLAGFLRWYQLNGGYAPGAVLGAFLVVGIAGIAAPRTRRPELRAFVLFTCLTAGAVLGTAALTEFSWRYQLPALVLAPTAAALGITAWRRKSHSARRQAAGDTTAAGR